MKSTDSRQRYVSAGAVLHKYCWAMEEKVQPQYWSNTVKMTKKRKDWKLSDAVNQREGTNVVHLQCACWNYVGGNSGKKNMLQLHKQGLRERLRGRHADVSWSCPLGGGRHLLGLICSFLWLYENKDRFETNSEKMNTSCLTKWLDLYTEFKTLYPSFF